MIALTVLTSIFTFAIHSAFASPFDSPTDQQAQASYEKKLNELVGLAQSLKAKDEEEILEPLSYPPTKKAIRRQIKAFVNDYLAMLESAKQDRAEKELNHFPGSKNETSSFRKNLRKQTEEVAERIEVLRKRREHFGPRAKQYSAARNPEFSVDEYLDQIASGVAHIVWAIENNCPDAERREALASMGVRFLTEAYLSAGATHEAQPWIEWPRPLLYVATTLLIMTVDRFNGEDWLTAFLEAVKDVGPAMIFIGFPLYWGNLQGDRKALRTIEPLMEDFWRRISSELSHSESEQPPNAARERIWKSLLAAGPPRSDAVSADTCEELLAPLIEKPIARAGEQARSPSLEQGPSE